MAVGRIRNIVHRAGNRKNPMASERAARLIGTMRPTRFCLRFRRRLTCFGVLLAVAVQATRVARGDEPPVAPIRALLITGGGFHDYDRQKQIITEGISVRANVQWKIFHENGDPGHELSIYAHPDFAKGCDVVVHNECYADVTDPACVDRALAPHRAGVPAVVLHCTLHTFRALKTDQWREFLGVSSNHHGPPQPIAPKVLVPGDPIMIGFPASWITGPEELYSVDKIWPDARVLAETFARDERKNDPVIWTNLYRGSTRVFGTTLAHNNATMEDPVYLGLITRGLLWACGKLDDQGRPAPGYGPPGPPK